MSLATERDGRHLESQTASSLAPLLGDGRIRAHDPRGEPLHTASWLRDRVIFDRRRWSGGDAELAWTAPHHLVVLTEEGGTAQTVARVGGKLMYDGRDEPGALSFIPASADRLCAYRAADLVYTALWIDPALQASLRGCEDLISLPPMVNGSDTVVRSLLLSLRDEIAAGHHPGNAYVEHLVAVLLLRLAQLDGAVPRPQARGARLNSRALATVQDYIETNIAADIALSDLARLVNMPVDSFAQRFHAATGIAPYAYVIERRVRRAEALLRTTDMEIAAIASAVGFSSQSHLTTTFRRISGMTPRAYRARFFSGILKNRTES